MPIRRIRRRARRRIRVHPHKGVASSRSPKTNSRGGKVDVVGKVVPHSRSEVNCVFGVGLDAPLELGLVRADTDFEFREVGLEEDDLMLVAEQRAGCRMRVNTMDE